MRTLLALLLLPAAIAAADPKPQAKAAEPPAKCKKVIVGKGLERHATCEITAPIVVGTPVPKPGVIVVDHGGKNVTGRPKSDDRLSGLSHQLR